MMNLERVRHQFSQQLRAGLVGAAATTLDTWAARTPRAFEPQFHRIQINLMSGAYRRARDAAASLMATGDCPPRFALEALSCLKAFALHDVLIAWAQRYPWTHKLPARDLALAAIDLSGVGAHALALEWAEKGVAKAPTDPICRVHRALILGYLGQFDRARADLDYVIATSPQSAMAYWILARSTRQTRESNHVAAMRQAMATHGLPPRDRAFLGYALFKELDDIGDYAGAWSALTGAGDAVRANRPYQRIAEEHLFAAIKRSFPLAAKEVAQIAGEPPQVPIFIVGLHRSGTSLVERMLGASSEVYESGETERLSAALLYGADVYCPRVPDAALLARAERIDFALVRQAFNQSARLQAHGRRFVTEKSPGNFLNVGFIKQALPHAKILHMRRDPVDLCFANFRELFGESVTHSYTLEDLVHYHGLYQDLMRYWHQSYPGFILDVDYERLVQNPEAESKRIFEYCDLPWRADVVDVRHRAAHPVSTLSSVQVRQPVNTASVGRWRNYAPWLDTLTSAFPVDR